MSVGGSFIEHPDGTVTRVAGTDVPPISQDQQVAPPAPRKPRRARAKAAPVADATAVPAPDTKPTPVQES